MKFLKSYKIYENNLTPEEEYFDLMGKLLHLYGGIPVPKEKSSIVIKKIVKADLNRSFK